MNLESIRIVVAGLRAINAQPEPQRTRDFDGVEHELHALRGGCRCEREAKATRVGHVEAEVTHFGSRGVCSVQVVRDSGTEDGSGPTIEAAFNQLAEV